ncbi:MAG: nucleotide exchange factor GrpE [Candidatus Pacebacteria bacterium]|nr:nucleotide exchange factor GrpE [Candidatus Paceibacterota bacterium]MBP9867264.1 nucleotide exchange factor GrpE [Candidatus Paceibacterota bacterium]
MKNDTEHTHDDIMDEEVPSTVEVEDENQLEGDDVSFEETNEEGEVDAKTTIKKLREKIKTLEAEKQEYLDQSLRTRADYVNFKKEVDTNRVVERKFATKRFIEELLPVLDSYDMAQSNKEAWEKVDQNWRMGIEYIFNQFKTVLENEGVMQFGKVGDMFDPHLHESMETINVENEGDNDKIMKVLQNGYKMHDSILRVARVHTGNYEKNN